MTATLILAALLQTAPTPAGGDWPQFRGPDRTGYSAETGLLKDFPADGPPKLATFTGLGGGYSGVAVSGGVVYGTGLLDDGTEYLWALDAAGGKQLWKTAIAPAAKVGYGDGPRGTPTVSEGRVFAVSMGGTLLAADAKTGAKLWSVDYVKDFGGTVPAWGYAESVLAFEGNIIASPASKDAAMVALKAGTGEVVWKAGLKSQPGPAGGYSSAVLTRVGGAAVALNLVGQKAGCAFVGAATGELLFEYNKPLNSVANIPSPVVKGDRVWVSTGYADGGSALLKITAAGDKLTLVELKAYKARECQNHHGGMVAVGNNVYFGHAHNQGHPCCVSLDTGEIRWQETKGSQGGDGSAAVLGYEDRLVFRYQNGVVALVAASPDGYEAHGAFKTPDPSGKAQWAHPALAGGKLYVRDQDKLHVYDLRAGK